MAVIDPVHARGTSNRANSEFHADSLAEPEVFWAQEAARIDWHKPFTKVRDYSKPPFCAWYVGGETNLCHNAIDRHLAARGDQVALVWISTEVDQQRTFTYRQLHDEVSRFAALLAEQGVGRGLGQTMARGR